MREEYEDMGKEALKVGLRIQEIMDLNPDTEPVIDNMWANVSQFGAHNRNHTHPGSHFSFVYYLQSPEKCGSIWFSDPRAQAIAVQLHIIRKIPEREKHLMKCTGLQFQAD